MAKAYKVVRCTDVDGRFRSAVADFLHAGARYVYGLATKPEDGCGPLCVFADVACATIFAEREFRAEPETHWAVLEVEYTPSPLDAVWCGLRGDTGRLYGWRSMATLPLGTILCVSVTPIKKLHDSQGLPLSQLVYKVVRVKADAHFQSATTFGNACRYQVNVPSLPKLGNGPLCAFKDTISAESFAYLYDGPYRGFCAAGIPSPEEAAWWANDSGDVADRMPLYSLPRGTILCSQVTLLEEMHP